jgi:mannose-1-phosphate guanylyltransferase
MAGGSGTRLWPMSRASQPKQLLRLCPDGSSLLQTSVNRLLGLFAYEDIYIIAAQHHLAAIAEDLPELPKKNLIGEPVGRDTANAVGLSAAILHARDPEAVMGIFTADHLIEPIENFQEAIRSAFDVLEKNPEYLGTFGITPTSPHTGLGYIHRGKKIKSNPTPVYQVQEFKEKPNLETAQQYLDSGEYYWNSGMFVWKVSTILDQLQTHLPENTEKLLTLGRNYGRDDWARLAGEIYPKLEKISIDFAVMEKAKQVMVVELGCRWADVGSWSELENITGRDEAGNAVLAKLVSLIESKDNVVISSEQDHLVALLGAEDMVVVHTADATLVCPLSYVQKIKDLVAHLDEQFGKKYT